MAYTTINKPSDYFNTITWTGDSTTPKTITGVGFQPDLIWGKIRSQTYSHQVYDTVRGFGNDKELTPDNTNAEGGTNAEQYGYLSGVTSDGFTAVRGTNPAGDDYWNESPDTYVAWNWKANGAGSSNTDGSITSTVSANTTSGFSIVKWNGQTGTVGHGLGAKPAFIVVKCLAIANNWVATHKGLGNLGNNYIILQSTGASGSVNWGGEPTSSVFSINANVAENSNNIAYCFAEKKGFSKFGSYTGNGSNDGPFIYTGFKPAWVLLKNTTTSGLSWNLYDNKRLGYNVDNNSLYANLSATEVTDDDIDFVSNGFKLRRTANNQSGANIIYMCFAEHPLVSSSGVPCTAR